MNLRLVIIGVILVVAAIGLYLFLGDSDPPPPEVAAPPPKSDLDEILVAAHDIPVATNLSELDLKWTPFPISALRPGMIAKSAEPAAILSTKGSFARVPILEGEPIRRDKLVKSSAGGFVSATLPTGMRAMSVSIDPNGLTNAGGFVLPNDRVDVMRAARSGDSSSAEVVLSDVRVIAIGRNLQDPQGPDRTVQGGNATLEVSAEQARALAVGQQLGGLFLVLRSLQDMGRPTPPDRKNSLTIIRYGAPVTLGR
jgi:pilus assembly protein CpaB